MKKILLTLCGFLFYWNLTASSGFVKLLYGLTPLQVQEGKNKSAVVLTETYYRYNPIYYLQETDSLGNVMQLVDLFSVQDTTLMGSVDVHLTQNKDIFVISHIHTSTHKLSQKVSKISNGQIEFTVNTITNNNDSLQPLSLRTYANTTDNGFVQLLVDSLYAHYYLQKINNNGSIAYTKRIPDVLFNDGIDTLSFALIRHELRILEKNGKFSITGIGKNTAQQKFQIFQAIYDEANDNFAFNRYPLPEIGINSSNIPFMFGDAFTTANTERISVMNYDSTQTLNTYFVFDLDVSGGIKTLQYSFTDSSNNINFPRAITFDAQGNLYTLKANSLIKRNPSGSIKWKRILFPDRVIAIAPMDTDFIFMRNFSILSDSNFYIIGSGGRGYFNLFCLCVGVLLKVDKEGILYRRQIKGNVYADANNSCTYNAEYGVRNVIIQAANSALTYYALTDSVGNYSIPVENGSYTVKVVLPDTLYWQACSPSVQINTLTDTSKVDFALQKKWQCPLLQTDISIPYLRRCFENVYAVHYCNNGTTTAENAYIQVEFPPEFSVRQSSIPWSNVSDNKFTFMLGNIEEQACGTLYVTAYLSCGDSTVLGETHCVQAYIFPDSLCALPDARWDGSVVSVRAECLGDSVRFTVTNTGVGNMTNPNISYVLEGDFLRIAPVYFQLAAGQSKTYTYATEGLTQTFVAVQSAYYPFGGNATVSIEGCNGFTPGYVTHFSQESNSPFTAQNCMQNIGSYDPNFKMALPVGLDSLHFVSKNTALQYCIHFQNTGTDTAFTIVLIDSLSPLLDITTFKPGGSSHPCRFNLEGNGVLRVLFPNILLPDSTTNTAASEGYFSFSIKPKNNVAENTQILNRATIYFDFNEGIETGTVWHTLKENLYQFLPDALLNKEHPIAYNVYPNPFAQQFVIQISDIRYSTKEITCKLYNTQGKEVYSTEFMGSTTIGLSGFPANMYFIYLLEDKKIIAKGKIIKQ